MTVREIREDFQTGADAYEGTSSVRRLDAISQDYLVARAAGPQARGDGSAGLTERVWRVRADNSGAGGTVYLQRSTYSLAEYASGLRAYDAETVLFSFSGVQISEVDVGFDQNGNVVVCAERPTGGGGGAEVWLYWYDSRVGDYLFSSVCAGRTPRLLLDDPVDVVGSDLLLFYLNDATQYPEVRAQRDFFTAHTQIPRDRWFDLEDGSPSPIPGTANLFLEEVARAVDNRLHCIASTRNATTGKLRFIVAESAPYPTLTMESAVVGQALTAAQVLTYIQEGFADDAMGPAQYLSLVSLIDLIITSLADDSMAVVSLVGTVTVQDLVLILNQPNEDKVSTVQAVSSATVTTNTIATADQPAEEAKAAQTISSVTVTTL